MSEVYIGLFFLALAGIGCFTNAIFTVIYFIKGRKCKNDKIFNLAKICLERYISQSSGEVLYLNLYSEEKILKIRKIINSNDRKVKIEKKLKPVK